MIFYEVDYVRYEAKVENLPLNSFTRSIFHLNDNAFFTLDLRSLSANAGGYNG